MTIDSQTRVRRLHSRPRCGVSVPLHGVGLGGAMETWTNPGRYYTPKVPRRVVGRRDFSALSAVNQIPHRGQTRGTRRTCVGYASSINSKGAALEQNEMPTPTAMEEVLTGLLEGRVLDVLVALAPMSIPTFQDVDWIATPANITKAPTNSAALRPSRSDTRGEKGSP